MAGVDEAVDAPSPVRTVAPAGWRAALERATSPARFSSSLLLVGLGGLALRLVLGRFEPLPPTGLVADETWYVRVAHSVVNGKGFVWPVKPFAQTALHGPLTVLLLAPATLLQPYGYTAQRATMALVGALGVVVIGLVGRELAGPRVGVAAAVVAALYPGLWVNDLVATSESPAVLLLAVVLFLSLRVRRDPATGTLVGLGLALGLLALDRGELAILGVLLAVPAIVAVARTSAAPAATAVRALLVVGVLAVLVVVPWSAYNQVRFHQTVPISTDLGQTLVGANCPQSYYGPLTGYNGDTCFLAVLYAYHNLPAPQRATEADADRYFRHAATTYAVHHWHRWPVVGLLREAWLWSVWRPAWTVRMASVYLGRPAWIAWSQIVGFWLLTPLALYGFVLARRRRIPVAPLVTLVAFAAAVGLLVVGNLRYRLPAELAWVLLAAIAVDRLVLGAPRGAPTASVGGGDLR
ncbi:MAG TPA: glycosyltransferase family 39 protein [Acidimicrobiales bacterium]|jgi:4-amino-4-deoxy-L-arabinose transferase-like glycosyltransferase|nr:glycosyltransferase family 39 protein [Acidimicrobiales bacterium]